MQALTCSGSGAALREVVRASLSSTRTMVNVLCFPLALFRSFFLDLARRGWLAISRTLWVIPLLVWVWLALVVVCRRSMR